MRCEERGPHSYQLHAAIASGEHGNELRAELRSDRGRRPRARTGSSSASGGGGSGSAGESVSSERVTQLPEGCDARLDHRLVR